MGKSFEIRPTGVAHAELLIPESWVAESGGKQYPSAKGMLGEGKVVEHYTWKKVTTNVSGFILGSPTIDHYGDMIVRSPLPVIFLFVITDDELVDNQPSNEREMCAYV
jgi:hypothetical protein